MECAINRSAAATGSTRPLDGEAKLRMVVEAETLKEGETIADVRRRHGVGRTCLFVARQRVREALEPRKPGPDQKQRELERLRQENKRLRERNEQLAAELGEVNDRLSRSVEVTTARIIATALTLLLCPVSTRKAHQVLVVAFGEHFAPADNTLAGWLLRYGRLARKIMADSAAALLVRSAAADEIYFHGKPILCAVETRSLAICALERAEDCTADTWEIVFDDFENLELVATDLGKGLLGAVDRSDAISQADMLHFGWLFPKVEAKLDEEAEEALATEARLRDHVNDPRCPGRKPHKALAEAEAITGRALGNLEAFLQAKELVRQAMSPWTADHRLATPMAQFRRLERAIELLDSIRAPRSGADRLTRTLCRHTHRLVAFLWSLWEHDVLLRRGSRWRPKRVIAAVGWHAGLLEAIKRAHGAERQRLIALLPRAGELRAEAFRQCRNAAAIETALLDRLRFLERSSSLAETINSKLRPLQAIKKQVSQPYLNLFALHHNLTPFERSDKRGCRSPYELLGVRLEGDEAGFLGVLLSAARREGLLK